LRDASAAPMGSVPSVVMLHAKLRAGMPLTQLLRCAGSLGKRVADAPEAYEWADASGAVLRAELHHGSLVSWVIERPLEGNVPSS
jgi:hypothetical protein